MCRGGASPEGVARGGVSGLGVPLVNPNKGCPNFRYNPEVFLWLGWGGQFLGLRTDDGLLVTSTRLLLYVISVLCLLISPAPALGPILSESVSEVLGSLRSRGWAGAKSLPPLSLLPILATGCPKPGLRETMCGLCPACAYSFCSSCFSS